MKVTADFFFEGFFSSTRGTLAGGEGVDVVRFGDGLATVSPSTRVALAERVGISLHTHTQNRMTQAEPPRQGTGICHCTGHGARHLHPDSDIGGSGSDATADDIAHGAVTVR